jgi:hypothetical protein
MARWERDPRLRRRLAWALAAAETVAVTLNFHFIFAAYAYRLLVAISGSARGGGWGLYAVVLVATGLCLVGTAVLGFLYVRGDGWVRPAFVAGNIILVGLGLVWFFHNIIGKGQPDPYATYCGLLLPLVTLFPLLWPLWTFRPGRHSAVQAG